MTGINESGEESQSLEASQKEGPLDSTNIAAAPDIGIGQSYQALKDSQDYQPRQALNQKTSKWQTVFTVIGVLQVGSLIGFLLFLILAVFGGGSIGVVMFFLLALAYYIPCLGILAVVNLIGYPIFMYKHRVGGKKLLFGVLSLLLSLVICAYAAFFVYQTRVVLPERQSDFDQKMQTEKAMWQQEQDQTDELQQQDVTAEKQSEITKDEAVVLLKACKLREVDVDHQTYKEDGYWGELSSTGVVLVQVEGVPDRISIADRLKSEIVSVAEQAQQNCEGFPQIMPTYVNDSTM